MFRTGFFFFYCGEFREVFLDGVLGTGFGLSGSLLRQHSGEGDGFWASRKISSSIRVVCSIKLSGKGEKQS